MPLPPDGTNPHVLNVRTATLDDILDLFRALSGREPTAEEVERVRRKWEEVEKRREE